MLLHGLAADGITASLPMAPPAEILHYIAPGLNVDSGGEAHLSVPYTPIGRAAAAV